MNAWAKRWSRHALHTRRLGQLMWPLGWLLLTFGVFGQIGAAAEAVRREGQTMILADLYPGLPTSFIPEGWPGFGSALFLVMSGWLCNRRRRGAIHFPR